MEKILILGSGGMLGGQLRLLFPAAVAWDREDADLTRPEEIEKKIAGLPQLPEAVINCAAYNDVDGAEDHPADAMLLNAEVPGMLSDLCQRLSIPLVHFSSNYVFGGTEGEYAEDAEPSPLSVYGHSKALGEQAVLGAGRQALVIRTSVLFGPRGKSPLSKRSFFEMMLDLSEKSDTIKAVADEINSVTYAPDLARAVQQLLEEGRSGIYHVTNSGQASWFDLASELFARAGKNTNVVPVSSKEFPRPARRPVRAVLRNTKFPPLRSWQESLAEFLSAKTST